jgi:hypothetical protein
MHSSPRSSVRFGIISVVQKVVSNLLGSFCPVMCIYVVWLAGIHDVCIWQSLAAAK